MTVPFNPLRDGLKNHTVDWKAGGQYVTLDEFKNRQHMRKRKKHAKARN